MYLFIKHISLRIFELLQLVRLPDFSTNLTFDFLVDCSTQTLRVVVTGDMTTIYIYDTLAHTVTSVRDPGDVVEMFGVRNAEAAHAVSVAALL